MAKKPEFSLKLENSKILKGIVETLSSIIDESKIKITPKELTISAMDPSRICLLKLSMEKGAFDEFQCAKECEIGVNLDDLEKILKRSDNRDSLVLEFSENEQKLKIKMQREGSERARTFSLALLDFDQEEIPMDNLLKIEYASKWTMDPALLNEALKDAEIYSEILNIKAAEEEGLTFTSNGQIGEMEYELGKEELIEAEFDGTHTGAYSLTFLKSILKLSSITDKLEVSLKTDHPLKMVFNLVEGGELNYFLAPRVEEADFDEDEDGMEEF